MKRMEILELEAHMRSAIQDVQEGETIEVTNQGKVVALLVPAPSHPNEVEIQADLASLEELAAEIGKYAVEPTNVAEVLSDMRR